MLIVRPAMDTKALRERLSLTQAELAALLGTHAMTVSKWERGKLEPGEHHRRLLTAFARAAERGTRFDGKEAGRDPVRFLSQLLDQAYRAPQLDLGTLSATNRFPGRVVQVSRGDVMSKLVLEIAPGIRIGSVITTDSVDRLGLRVGSPSVAIIKATEVILAST
jgi:molybdopterin-binding protein